jgi:hypothetical protein
MSAEGPYRHEYHPDFRVAVDHERVASINAGCLPAGAATAIQDALGELFVKGTFELAARRRPP